MVLGKTLRCLWGHAQHSTCGRQKGILVRSYWSSSKPNIIQLYLPITWHLLGNEMTRILPNHSDLLTWQSSHSSRSSSKRTCPGRASQGVHMTVQFRWVEFSLGVWQNAPSQTLLLIVSYKRSVFDCDASFMDCTNPKTQIQFLYNKEHIQTPGLTGKYATPGSAVSRRHLSDPRHRWGSAMCMDGFGFGTAPSFQVLEESSNISLSQVILL